MGQFYQVGLAKSIKLVMNDKCGVKLSVLRYPDAALA